MLPRVLEPEVMDTPEEAQDYDAMDHSTVNRVFVADFLAACPLTGKSALLDVGTGTAQIPIELCRQLASQQVHVTAIDAAAQMLAVAENNVRRAGLQAHIQLQCCDAKKMPFPDAAFQAIISNSIVHHIPEPFAVLREMCRVVSPHGCLFVRDLLRPNDDTAVRHLVETYAGDANAHQRQMFEDSLRAALTLEELRAMVTALGFDAATVRQTSDRHWTWVAPVQAGSVRRAAGENLA
jgi:ubiquinone/menaquinone biosynthesis C-methylase UbiE